MELKARFWSNPGRKEEAIASGAGYASAFLRNIPSSLKPTRRISQSHSFTTISTRIRQPGYPPEPLRGVRIESGPPGVRRMREDFCARILPANVGIQEAGIKLEPVIEVLLGGELGTSTKAEESIIAGSSSEFERNGDTLESHAGSSLLAHGARSEIRLPPIHFKTLEAIDTSRQVETNISNFTVPFTLSGIIADSYASVEVPTHIFHSTALVTHSSAMDGSYASQAKLITSKAMSMGLQMNDFQAIFKEKKRVAENRFPGESLDWQTWYAESMVWMSFFKEREFPGVEPPRLYPLRSSDVGEVNRQGHLSSRGNKWIKTSLKTGERANLNSLDSYRPSGLSRTERSTARSIDSYRPNDLSRNPSHAQKSSTSQKPSTGSLEKPISSEGSTTSRDSKLASASNSVIAPLSRSANLGDSQPTTYQTLESVMEKKAIACRNRREFFQYVQKMRDRVRAEHPSCSAFYRSWAADALIWERFFEDEPFPGIEPRGPDMHAGKCPQRSRVSSSSASSPPMSRSAPTTSRDMPRFQTPPQPVSAPEPKPQVQPPRELMIEISRKRLINQRTIPKETKALMVNKAITWTTDRSVRNVLQLFSDININLKDLLENKLKCHLRSYKTSAGDGILWTEAFVANDSVAFERGDKFLQGWFESTLPGGATSGNTAILEYWEKFAEAEKLEGDRMAQDKPALVLINGRYFNCTVARVVELSALYMQEDTITTLAEESMKCTFLCSRGISDQRIIMFSAEKDASVHGISDEEATRDAHAFLEAWVCKVLSMEEGKGIKISQFWEEYKDSQNRNRKSEARLLVQAHAQSVDEEWGKYACMFQATEVDRLVMEEAAKLEGNLRMVFDEETSQVICLDEFARRVVERAGRHAHEIQSNKISDCAKRKVAGDDNNKEGREEKRLRM